MENAKARGKKECTAISHLPMAPNNAKPLHRSPCLPEYWREKTLTSIVLLLKKQENPCVSGNSSSLFCSGESARSANVKCGQRILPHELQDDKGASIRGTLILLGALS